MTITPWNGNSWRIGDLRQKCPLSGGGGGGEYGLYNLSNIVENILALNPKGLYLSVEKKKKETCFLLFTYSIKRVHEIRMFRVPVSKCRKEKKRNLFSFVHVLHKVGT